MMIYRTTVLFIPFFLLPGLLLAQEKARSTTKMKISSVLIELKDALNDSVKMNSDHSLEIKTSKYKCRDLEITFSGCDPAVKPTGSCSYVVKTTVSGKITITVSIRTSKGIKELAKREFIVY